MNGGGGKGKGPSSWCSKDGYFESKLRPEDCEAYSSSGILMYRKAEKGVEVLLALEKPWNPLVNDYDPLAWNPILGKKTAGGPNVEWDSAVTAARNVLEVFGGCEGAPEVGSLQKMCHTSPVLWYPNGRFALYIHEYSSDDGDVFPEAVARFAAAKEKGLYPHTPAEEGRVNAKGQPMTKWVKQIEELEWVSGETLVQESTPKPLTDLLKNLVKITSFSEFLTGGVPPPSPTPPAEGSEGARPKGGKNSKGGGKNKDGGGKKGGGSKGSKNKGDNFKGGGGKGKGGMPPYAFMPPPPPMNPQMYPIEMQRQMLGEKLYMLVQPMVPTAVVAQKVTGMLLELPMPELMPLLGPGPEERNLLQQRVDEAMEVLASDEAGQ